MGGGVSADAAGRLRLLVGDVAVVAAGRLTLPGSDVPADAAGGLTLPSMLPPVGHSAPAADSTAVRGSVDQLST